MEKLSNTMRKLLYITFTALFCVLFAGVIFGNMHFDYKWYITLPCAFVWTCIIGSIARLIFKKREFFETNEAKLLAVFFSVLLLTQIFFFTQMASYPTRDLENVFRSAYYYAIQGSVDALNTDYLYKHPNNLTWVIRFQYIFRIARKFGADAYMTYIIIASVVNGIAIARTYLFVYLCCKKLFGRAEGFFALVLLYSCLPLQFNISFFYTDTLTMPFIPMFLYFYLRFRDEISIKNGLLLTFTAFATAFGVHLKYSVIIVFIAVVIDMVLKADFKRLSATVLSFLVAFLCLKAGLDHFTYGHILDKELARDAATPFSSYIMMGLNGDGAFNVGDRYFAWAFETKEEKEEKIREQISIRLSQHTPVTFLQHLHQKGIRSFGSGNMEYNYTISNAPVKQTFLVQCVSPRTKEFVIMGYIVQGWHIMLFISVIASAVMSLKKSDYRLFVPILSVFGLYLFLLLWEASRRYLINYTAMYIICAVYLRSEIIGKTEKS